MPWDYKVGYTSLESKMCVIDDTTKDSEKEIKPEFEEELYLHQCVYKCTQGGKSCTNKIVGDTEKPVLGKDGVEYPLPCFCGSGSDTEDANVICGDAELCKELCDSHESCYGFHMKKDEDRCILLKSSCQTEVMVGLDDSDAYDYYAKMDPERAGGEGCPMGVAVLPENLVDPFPSCTDINDQYNMKEGTSQTFTTGCAELTWAYNGCGWMVQVPTPAPPAPAAVDEDDHDCVNHDAEANWMMANDPYDPNMCKGLGESAWGYIYCSWYPALTAACQATCLEWSRRRNYDYITTEQCTAWNNGEDNPAAAADAGSTMGLGGDATCEMLRAEGGCIGDPLVRLVCPATCVGAAEETRRLTPAQKRIAEKFEAKTLAARQSLDDVIQARIEANKAEIEAEEERRLQENGMTTLYASWDPTEYEADKCTAGSDPAYTDVTKATWHNWHKWRTDQVQILIEPDCEDQRTFITHSNKYCNNNNMVIEDPEMQQNLCWNKCLADGTSASGEDDPTCAGTDEAFNRYSNALCVTRETCESYCEKLGAGNCWGFEMHTSLPRCYLIDAPCGADTIDSALYDQVEMTFGEYRYVTQSSSGCKTRGKYSDEGKSREACELECNADPECQGFNYWYKAKMCEFLTVDPNKFKAASYCSVGGYQFGGDPDPSATTVSNLLQPSDEKHFVEKMLSGASKARLWRLPCSVKVTPAHNGLLPPYNSMEVVSYGRSECDDLEEKVCYIAPGGKYRLVWGLQPLLPELMVEMDTPITRQCAGWVMEDEAGTPLYTTWKPDTCPEAPTDPAMTLGDTGYPLVYHWKPQPEAPPLPKMQYVCKSYPLCGTLHTCVLAKNRFESELGLILSPGAPVEEGLIGSWTVDPTPGNRGGTRWESIIDKDSKPATFRPKTLVSPEMAAAFIWTDKLEFAHDLYRNVPGPLGIKIGKVGPGITHMIIRMQSPDGDSFAGMPSAEGGYSDPVYADVSGYEPWITDVVRGEFFWNPDYTYPADYEVEIQFHAPSVPHLKVFRFAPDGTMTGPYPTTLVPGTTDYWSFTTAGRILNGAYGEDTGLIAGYDYVGTTEKPCPAMPPAVPFGLEGWKCDTLHGGSVCTTLCMPNYVRTGDLVCKMGVWEPVAGTLDGLCEYAFADYPPETQFFRLSSRSRLDYGWRIRQVRAFEDYECTKAVSSTTITGPTDSYMGTFPATENKDLVNTKAVSAESGCLKSPTACNDFWSMGLNVNPYSVDETHDPEDGDAFLEFTVDNDDKVLCIEVVSRSMGPDALPRQYYPDETVLHRGYADDDYRTLERSMTDYYGWTEMWKPFSSEQSDSGFVQKFRTECGEPDSRIFGELLLQQDGVMSACFCKQLCIDNIEQGCVSWNYLTTAPFTCYLQSSIKPAPSATCEAPANYISGYTGVRIKGTSPKKVQPGQSFDLKLEGVNMPSETNAFLQSTTPSRQRVKLVPKMTGKDVTSCADSPVADTVEGIGCSHPFFCAPRPSSVDMDHASWSGLKIHGTGTSAEQVYTVCYNRGLTYDRYEWYKIDEITVGGSTYAWSTDVKLMRTTESFTLTVADTTPGVPVGDPDTWRVKVIKAGFECNIVRGDSKLNITGTGGAPRMYDVADLAKGTASWEDILLFNAAEEQFAAVGLYKVCLSTGGKFEQIPSTSGDIYLEIEAEEGYSTHAKDVFTYQTLSGSTTGGSTFTLKGFQLSLPSSSKIGFTEGTCGSSDDMTFMAEVDSDLSTADGYVFKGTVGGGPGTYNACFCNDQDAGPAGAGEDKSTVYKVTTNYACSSSDAMPYVNMSAETRKELCTVKCARGCTASDCYCDSFSPDRDYVAVFADGAPYPLCVSAAGCQELCDAEEDSCTGFVYDPSTSMCMLLMEDVGACSRMYVEGFQIWERFENYTSCSTPEEYTKSVGTVTLTARADVGVDWVLTPGETASIEVLGGNLSWHTDRLMIIDCSGICGISGPTKSMMLAEQLQAPQRNAHWRPVPPMFIDPPHDDDEIPREDGGVAPTKTMPKYNTLDGVYCAGNNMMLMETDEIFKHQCYKKCVAGKTCVGDDCYCEGLLQGYDTASSQALCLDQDACEKACAEDDHCVGIDMHADKPRCFLNMKSTMTEEGTYPTDSCEFQVDAGMLQKFPTYNYIYKQGARRLESAPERKMLAAVDEGVSWDEMLRFTDVTFATGGQFKACFCDVDTLAEGKYCKKASDYKIEIGTIHVSGVSCLISEKKFQRGTCVEQRYGGLRCYPGAAPTYTLPEKPAAVVMAPAPAAGGGGATPIQTSYCLYGPEEETRDDPFCTMD
jgi:hypothetical protein